MDNPNIVIIDREGKTRLNYSIEGFEIRKVEDPEYMYIPTGNYIIPVDTDDNFFDIQPYDNIIFCKGDKSLVGTVVFKDYYDENHRYIKVKAFFAT